MPIQVHRSDPHGPGRSCLPAPILRAARLRTRSIVNGLSALLMATLLIGCSPVPPDASPSSATPASREGYPLLSDHQGDSPLEPGAYAFSVADAPSAPYLPVLTVPEGYSAIEDGIGVIASDDESFVWVWNIELVNTHPCDALGHPAAVGPSTADLANALASQPLRDGTEPVPISIGNYDGYYVKVSVPDDIDIAECHGGRFNSWPGRAQTGGAGQVDMLWILDLEGQRITFDASYAASASPAVVEELEDMVMTATFDLAKEAE